MLAFWLLPLGGFSPVNTILRVQNRTLTLGQDYSRSFVI
jgi:hypothetical protein